MKKSTVVITAVIILIFFVLTMVLPFIPVNAESVQDLQQKLNKANNEINKLQKGMKQAEEKKQDTKENIQQVEKKIDTVEGTINNLSSDIVTTVQKINEVKKQLDEANEEYEKQKQLFLTRVRVMYEESNTTYLDVILNSKSFTDFQYRMGLVKEIVEFDTKLMDDMEANKQKIENLKKEQETEKARLETLRQQNVTKKESLADQQETNEQYLNQINKEIEKYAKSMDDWEAVIEQTKKDIQRIQAAANRKFAGGKFGLPVDGVSRSSISSDFGPRFHPVLKVNKPHTGIDFPKPTGTPVYAANDGVVILASYNGGYGNCVIIDHGGGIATLYAHNSALLVSNGTSVKRGDVIAKVGTTGFSTGPHCHFEVIINGNQVDPKPYLFGN